MDNPASTQIITILGDQRTAVVARELDHFLRHDSYDPVGLVIRKKAFINGEMVKTTDIKTKDIPKNIVKWSDLEVLVYTSPVRQVSRNGLCFDRLNGAAIMDLLSDQNPVEYQEALNHILDVNEGMFVVDARNKQARQTLKPLDPGRVIYVSQRGQTPAVRRHLASGGMAAVVSWHQRARKISIIRETGVLASFPVPPALPAHTFRPVQNTVVAINPTGHRSRRIEIKMFAAALTFNILRKEKLLNNFAGRIHSIARQE